MAMNNSRSSMVNNNDGCSSMVECTVVVRETRVRFPPSVLLARTEQVQSNSQFAFRKNKNSEMVAQSELFAPPVLRLKW